MQVTFDDFKKGLFIDHKPTGNVFYRSFGGMIVMNGETYTGKYINDEGLIIEGRQFMFADCELSRLNFTECPHCKKLF